MNDPAAARQEPRRLLEVALVFLKLGVTAFGGPAAHIAMMDNEIVRRRRWVTPERFLDLLGVSNLVPGPSSSELAVYLGYERAGVPGLIAAALCFVSPAALMVAALARAYVQLGTVPRVQGALYGLKPVVIAVVVQAVWALAPRALRSKFLAFLSVVAGAAAALGVSTLAVLLGSGLIAMLAHARSARSSPRLVVSPALAAGSAAVAVAPVSLTALFVAFLKIGATVFGSGYVLLAYLRGDLVDRLHWLTEAQLLDAVAVGQVTPGPVFTTATFIGYLVAGAPGAVVATVAIFLPGFTLVALTRPLIGRIRGSPWAGAFLDGVNVAAVALIAVVGAELARAAIVDTLTAVLAVTGVALLLLFRVNTTWLVLGGAAVGMLAK
jgi:chromate transporter